MPGEQRAEPSATTGASAAEASAAAAAPPVGARSRDSRGMAEVDIRLGALLCELDALLPAASPSFRGQFHSRLSRLSTRLSDELELSDESSGTDSPLLPQRLGFTHKQGELNETPAVEAGGSSAGEASGGGADGAAHAHAPGSGGGLSIGVFGDLIGLSGMQLAAPGVDLGFGEPNAVGSFAGPDDSGDAPPRPLPARRGGLGIANSADLYCDVCDLPGGRALRACMAEDMLQQTRIARLVVQFTERRRRAPSAYGDGRPARYPIYREVVRWQFVDVLGAEQRVRLPPCVLRKVRQLFPNPLCGDGCDYGAGCEAGGHYTGFRTAAVSRAIREGSYLDVT